jgi:hypothetical protein
MNIQLESKLLSQDNVTADIAMIGWDESDAVVLRRESP